MKRLVLPALLAGLLCAIPLSLSALTIWEAVDSGDLAAVKKLVSQTGFKINQKNKDGETPLIRAASYGDLAIVQLLISKQAVLNEFEYKYRYYYNAAHAAAAEGHLDVLQALDAAGANMTAQDKDGWTPLILAAQNGHTDVVKYLVSKGCYIDAKAHNGESAMSLAARNGHSDVVNYLVKKGAKGKIPEVASGGMTSPVRPRRNNNAASSMQSAASRQTVAVSSKQGGAASSKQTAAVSSKASQTPDTSGGNVAGNAGLAAKVVQVAKDTLGAKSVPSSGGKWFRSDCIGFVSYCFYEAGGVDLWDYAEGGSDNGCELVYNGMKSRGMVFDVKLAKPGDIIFFNNTYDFNGNGAWDDPLTHVGVVVSKTDFDTMVFIHWASGAVKEYHMNLYQPDVAYTEKDDGSRFMLNNWLRRNKGEGYPDSHYITSFFYHRFARVKG